MSSTHPSRPTADAPRRRRGPRARTTLATAAVATAVVTVLTACDGSSSADASSSSSSDSLTVGALSNGAAAQKTLTVKEDKTLHDELPASVKKAGTLTIGVAALPSGYPPLAYVGTDSKTLTGSEPDLGRLVAKILGLEPVVKNATWENNFVAIDSGKVDAGFTNITDTEQRKEKYDFACYREDELAFEANKSAKWTFSGDPSVLAGKNITVGSGTNQEKILLQWQSELKAQGKNFTISYYADSTSQYAALASGKIDAIFGPNPTSAYHVRQTAKTTTPTKIIGTFSGAGKSLQGLICATTKKDDGLVKPIAGALNKAISDGTYAATLKAWNLTSEGLPKATINPPGLPLSDS